MQQQLLSSGFRPLQPAYAPVPTLLHRPAGANQVQDFAPMPAPSLKATPPVPALKPIKSERPVQGQVAATPLPQRPLSPVPYLPSGIPAERQSEMNASAAYLPATSHSSSRTVSMENETMRAPSPANTPGPSLAVGVHPLHVAIERDGSAVTN